MVLFRDTSLATIGRIMADGQMAINGQIWPKNIFPLKFPLKLKKITNIGRKGPRAKTITVLKSVSKMQQLDSMPNLKCQTFLNKYHPSVAPLRESLYSPWDQPVPNR